MIQPQTCLRVADNSGAKKLMCIRVLGSNRRYGFVGDVIFRNDNFLIVELNTRNNKGIGRHHRKLKASKFIGDRSFGRILIEDVDIFNGTISFNRPIEDGAFLPIHKRG